MMLARARTANLCLCKAAAKEEVNKVLAERSQVCFWTFWAASLMLEHAISF